MRLRNAMVVVVAGLLMAGPSCSGSGQGGTLPARDVVLVTLALHQGEGLPADPFGGSVFEGFRRIEDVVAACPEPLRSVASTLTGVSPDALPLHAEGRERIPPEITTLAQRIGGEGRATGAFVADPRIGRGSGLDRGFDVYDAPAPWIHYGPISLFPLMRPPEDAVANFRAWTDSLADERPFFAWLHLVDPWPLQDPRHTEPPRPAAEAVAELVTALDEQGRLARTSVWIVALSGPVAVFDAPGSDYLLTPAVVRAPLLVGGAAAERVDADRAVWLPDLAGTIEGMLGDPESAITFVERGSRPAWSWRGAAELGWPVQTAVVRGEQVAVRSGPQDPVAVYEWPEGGVVDSPPGASLMAALDEQPLDEAARLSPAHEIPGELREKLLELDERVPTPVSPREPVPAKDRLASVQHLLDARRRLFLGNDVGARQAYREAIGVDPANRAALIELGEMNSMGRHRKARARLEAALELDPFNARAWHAMGHAAYASQDIERADALWRLAEVMGPDLPDLLYDLACTRSLLEDLDGSAAYLERAWEAGFRNVEHIQADPDLRNLRAGLQFEQFMRKVIR